MIKYYICSVGDPSEDYDKDILSHCILDSAYYVHSGSKQKGDIKLIETDDILILKYKHSFIAFGRAGKPSTFVEGDGWAYKVEVSGWICGKAVYKQGIQAAQKQGNNYQTVKEVERNFARQKITEIGVPY